MEDNLESLWTSASFQPYLEAFPASARTHPTKFLDYIRKLVSIDSKEHCLKDLQGYIWRNGYENGTLRCPILPDVVPMLQKWHSGGIRILIYSSGSVAAQKLFFEYTTLGDLRPLLNGYFDTHSAGPKTETSSYSRIVGESTLAIFDPSEWLFFSDSILEVDAAVAAGMRALLVVREGNAVLSDAEKARCQVIENFHQVEINMQAESVE